MYAIHSPKHIYKNRFLPKASSDESTGSAAVLVEQAGTCLIGQEWRGVANLLYSKPLLRRYAFQCIMAGWLFQKCGMRSHAARCYGTVVNVYTERGWKHIDYHMGLNLGKWMIELGLSACAVEMWVKTLTMNGGALERAKQSVLLDLVQETLSQAVNKKVSFVVSISLCVWLFGAHATQTKIYFYTLDMCTPHHPRHQLYQSSDIVT
jgi:hypothetical protein